MDTGSIIVEAERGTSITEGEFCRNSEYTASEVRTLGALNTSSSVNTSRLNEVGCLDSSSARDI